MVYLEIEFVGFLLGRVCKSRFVDKLPYLEVQRIMSTTKSEGASAEDCGSDNFHRNRFPGTAIRIVEPVVLLCQCTWCLKVFFLGSSLFSVANSLCSPFEAV